MTMTVEQREGGTPAGVYRPHWILPSGRERLL